MSKLENPADRWNKTIVDLPLEAPRPLREMSLTRDDSDGHDIALSEQQFKLRLANSEGKRESASLLIKKMYAWRGYDTLGLIDDNPNRITLMADVAGRPIGTLTIGLDSPNGLLVDQLYRDEIDGLRASRAKVCELTKFAVDQGMQSKRLLAALFQLAYVYSHRIHQCTDVVIEVNPRHVVFYKRLLGFTQRGEQRMCPRVHAPAVLLHLPLAYAAEQIAAYAGRFADVPGVRSVYPYFLGVKDEDGITDRLLRGD